MIIKRIGAVFTSAAILAALIPCAVNAQEIVYEERFFESFDYADGTDSPDGWDIKLADDTGAQLEENYITITDGALNTKMRKRLQNREVHTISLKHGFDAEISGSLRLSADIGLDETGSIYTASTAAVDLLDAEDNIVVSIAKRSAYTDVESNREMWELNTNAAGSAVLKADCGYVHSWDGTINTLVIDANASTGKVSVLADNEKVLYENIPYSPTAVCSVRIRHVQNSYRKDYASSSCAVFDNLRVEEYSGEEPPSNDPAKDEDEGLENQTNILYDAFNYSEHEPMEGWTLSLPNDSALEECSLRTGGSVVTTKMKKRLTARDEHTIGFEKPFDIMASGEMTIRASIGLDEAGSVYTNSSANCAVLDTNGSEIVNIRLLSGYGETSVLENGVWQLITNKQTVKIAAADLAEQEKYDGTLHDVKLHLKPDEGKVDFYLDDMSSPIASAEYNARNVIFSGVRFYHVQTSYNRNYVTNSAARFGYVKADANVYIDAADAAAVERDCAEFDFSKISQQQPDRITKRLDLKTSTDRGSVIIWKSDREDIISADGFVTRNGQEDVTVTLEAIFCKGYASAKKQFVVCVPKIGVQELMTLFSEDFNDRTAGASASSEEAWSMDYPSPKSENTDVVYVLDTDKNLCARLSNDMNPPQSYAGFRGIYNFPQTYSGSGEMSFRLMIGQTGVESTFNVSNSAGTAVITLSTSGKNIKVNSVQRDGIPVFNENEWLSVRIVYNTHEGWFSLYINEQYCGTYAMQENYEQNYTIASCEMYSWNRSSGLNARVYMDDISVCENLTLQLENVMEEFYIASEAAGDFLLPTEYNGAKISYGSSDDAVLSVSADGMVSVNRQDSDTDVKLTAEFDYKGCKKTAVYDVRVIHKFSDEDNADADVQSLEFADLSSQRADRVHKDLILPDTGRYGSGILWKSSDESVIKIQNGRAEVIPAETDRKVTLTAEVICGDVRRTKEFAVTVIRALPQNAADDAQIIYASSQMNSAPVRNLADGDFSTEYTTSVYSTQNNVILDLGEVKRIGAAMLWCDGNVSSVQIFTSKDNDSYQSRAEVNITADGMNVFGINPTEARYVKLVLNPKTGGAQMTLSELMLFESLLTDEQCVKSDAQEVTVAARISSSITLPTEGKNGSVITWSSSNESVLSNSGAVKRPSADTVVKLTAKFVKNGASAERVYEVTVTAATAAGGGGSASSVASPKSASSGFYNQAPVGVQGAEERIFSDVADDAWYGAYVNELYKKGVVSGDENGRFNPDSGIKREEFAAMLMRALGISVSGTESVFSDTDASAWYAPYVYTMYEHGIISGIGGGEFGIGRRITRQDAAVMICRACGFAEENGSEWKDSAQIAEYAEGAVACLSRRGVISGSDGYFRPNDSITRAETAVLISRVMGEIK